MNKISVTIVLVLCFAVSAFTQSPSIIKGSTVVPKFAFGWSDLDKSWRGFLKLKLRIEQNSSGNLTINGNENWRGIPFFPAYDGSVEGYLGSFYQDQYPTPSVVAYKIDKIEKNKNFTEVSLSKLSDRVVDLKLRFGDSIKDLDKAFSEVFFLGGVEEFKRSTFYKNLFDSILEKEINKLPKELAELPRGIKVSLLEEVNYQSSGIWTETFKEKKYIVCSYADGTEYNTNRVNQAERIARTIQKYLPGIKRKGKLLLAAKEIQGIELKVKIAYRNFVNESQSSYENLQFYVPMDSLKLFIDADITDQELIDKSIVLLNDNRVRVNLSQFSN